MSGTRLIGHPQRWISGMLLSLVLAGMPVTVFADTPETRYKAYLATIERAKSLSEIFPYLADAKRQSIEDGLRKAEAQGADTRRIETQTLNVLRIAATAGRPIFEEMIIEDEASLVVERGEFTVQVLMVMEDGDWKIADERMLKIPNY